MTIRHIVSAISLGLVIAFFVGACGDGGSVDDDSTTSTIGTGSLATATTPEPTTPPRQDTTTTVDPADLTEVIVDLNVAWQPEPELSSDEEIAQQRAAIAEAQQQVIELLEGTSFRVIELYEMTPQMAIAVDGEGIFRMNTSDIVVTVSVDVPEAPTG